jgi:hypothetical protein
VVLNSQVRGDIQFEDGGSFEVTDTFIDGNLQLDDNQGSLLVFRNRIDGNLQASQNRGGPFRFFDNTIDGNLQCKENSPIPVGAGNVVGGNLEDQCRDFS